MLCCVVVYKHIRMKLQFSVIVYTLIICFGGCLSQDDSSLDALINSAFNISTPEGKALNCECVPYYQCTTQNTFNENGEDLIDIRVKPEECESYLEVCCGLGTTDSGVEVLTTTVPPQTPSTTTTTAPDDTPTCGQRNFQGVSSLRITGDEAGESQFGEFPWMIAVTKMQMVEGMSKPASAFQCGGSLVSPSVVLTAAHCVNNKTGLSVRAGEWDTQTTNEPQPLQIASVKEVVVHEQYRAGTLHNDVALLVLEKPLKLASHIGPICLPAQDENMDGRNCVASGWGKDVFGKEGKYQAILKKVELQTIPYNKCLEELRKTERLGSKFKLHHSFICAGGGKGSDTCQGDGGGPLVCPSSNDSKVYVQAGIVAWGIGCGSEIPGVYVNVPLYSNWIQEKLNLYG